MVLEKIQKENDIKKLTPEELELLKDEIRQFLIESISVTGGHLASNLGVVELTMALHLCFDLPKDKIVWDVGHQSYTHKILTGRKDGFSSLRQYGGMSGFPKADESDCDCFNTGHSSTSISAGLGLATARQVTGEDYHVVSVIGDGALTGVRAEYGGNAQGALLDESEGGGVPGGIAAGLEGGAQTAGGEGGGVGLAPDQLLAGKLHDDLTAAHGSNEAVVLLGGDAGHGLEPVGVMGGALLDGPLLHGLGDLIGGADVQGRAFSHALLPSTVGRGREPFLHGLFVKDQAAEQFGELRRCTHTFHPPMFLYRNIS